MPSFKSITKINKNFKSLHYFGERCFNITDVCMDFEPCFKIWNLPQFPAQLQNGQYVRVDEIKISCCKVINNISVARRVVFPSFVWNFLYFIGATCIFIIILRVLMHRQFPLPVVLDWCLFLDHLAITDSSLFVTLLKACPNLSTSIELKNTGRQTI